MDTSASYGILYGFIVTLRGLGVLDQPAYFSLMSALNDLGNAINGKPADAPR